MIVIREKREMYTIVKELREQKNISQLTLATRIGCSQNTISKIEKGECEPRANVLVEMSKYFGVSVDYILGISDVKNYAESSKRYGKVQNIGTEYQEKINQLSDKSKKVAQSVVDRLAEIERI